MKIIVYILAMLIGLASINADALTKKKSSKKKGKVISKTITQVDPAYVIGIGYPTITMAINSIKERKDAVIKDNAKPFGWQERTGPWYVVKEGKVEWAFTEGGHYAHPSVVKRIIDVGSTDHVNVDMAFRCEAENKADCDKLLSEFKEVNKLIYKVYEKKFITNPDGVSVWNGVDSLE